MCVAGAVFLIILLKRWEESIKKSYEVLPQFDIYSDSKISLEVEKEQRSLLQQSLDDFQEQIRQKDDELKKSLEEKDRLQKQALKAAQDFAEYKIFSEEQQNQKGLQIQSLQKRLNDQVGDLETKQEKISQFESKIRDLSYEIKTLLQPNETEPKEVAKEKKAPLMVTEPLHPYYAGEEEPSVIVDTQVHSSGEATVLLKRCIDTAQKLTGANYYGGEGMRHRDFSPHNYTIDLRRLFDSLRSENASLVLVYSQKDDKLLFVNNQSRTLLGWSSEKFIQDFQSIIQKSTVEWKGALNHVSTHYEARTRILMKTKDGSDLPIDCQLGVIPIGLFKGYVIGVLYSSL